MTTALCAETRTARSSRLTPTPSSWPPAWRPLRAEALALEPVSSEFRMVGDCKRPRQILEAVREGYDAAMEV